MSVFGSCIKACPATVGLDPCPVWVSFLVVETSWARPVAIDFGNLFSSSFDFLRFHTARVKLGPQAVSELDPFIPQERTCNNRCSISVSCQTRKWRYFLIPAGYPRACVKGR
jgi:hypothetical protein